MVYLKIRFIFHSFISISKITFFDIFDSDECFRFLNGCQVLLHLLNYPKHLSILASKVLEFANLIFDLCTKEPKELISVI